MRRPPSRVALSVAMVALAAMGAAIARAEVIQTGVLTVSTTATMRPQRLPRTGAAPISVSLAGQISTTDESRPPQLQQLTIGINRNGRLDYQGLPLCKIGQIQPASNSRALAGCRSALVGQGSFAGAVTLPGTATYPIEGRLLVFNGQEHGHEVLLGHIFSATPFATSFVIVFQIAAKHGQYGTVLTANIAKALGNKRNLTALSMTLSRRFSSGGHRHSYISAGCPAPKGFGSALFPLARTSFAFAGGTKLTSTLTSTCKVRG